MIANQHAFLIFALCFYAETTSTRSRRPSAIQWYCKFGTGSHWLYGCSHAMIIHMVGQNTSMRLHAPMTRLMFCYVNQSVNVQAKE